MGIIVEEGYKFNFISITSANLFERINGFVHNHEGCINAHLVEEVCADFNLRTFPVWVPLTGLNAEDQHQLKDYLYHILNTPKWAVRNEVYVNQVKNLLTGKIHLQPSGPSACAALLPLVSGAKPSSCTWHILLHGKVAAVNAKPSALQEALGSRHTTFDEAMFESFKYIVEFNNVLNRNT